MAWIDLIALSLISAVSWAVARPFFRPSVASGKQAAFGPADLWRRRKEEALAAIREAEFDVHMGKLSEADYGVLRHKLEVDAVDAMRALGEMAPVARVAGAGKRVANM